MAIPIPLALSLLTMALKKAKATNITDIKQPMVIIMSPTLSGELTNNGIPAPTKNAKTMDSESPKNKLNHIFFRWIGWLNKSSTNSELLYK